MYNIYLCKIEANMPLTAIMCCKEQEIRRNTRYQGMSISKAMYGSCVSFTYHLCISWEIHHQGNDNEKDYFCCDLNFKVKEKMVG